jgi:hypothetical protein
VNYFAHALPFLDRPYFVAGTGVPDWLAVVGRPLRLRLRHVEPFCDDADPCLADVARGIAQHLRDDARFHATRYFAETSLAMTVRVRDALACETGMRPAFLGHLLVELPLDASLVADHPDDVRRYYDALGEVDSQFVQSAVNRMAPWTTDQMAVFIGMYLQERILYDYLDDGRLMLRLNQVLRRVGQPCLPEGFPGILPAARTLVAEQRDSLMKGIPA